MLSWVLLYQNELTDAIEWGEGFLMKYQCSPLFHFSVHNIAAGR